MGGIRRKVEPISRPEEDVAIEDVERDGTLDAEQHFVEGMAMLPVGIAGLIGPGSRHQTLGGKGVGGN